VTEYALMIKLVDGTSSAHSCNPYAYFGHSWSYFDIQNLLYLLYIDFKYPIFQCNIGDCNTIFRWDRLCSAETSGTKCKVFIILFIYRL
jgi:hypothetical protein